MEPQVSRNIEVVISNYDKGYIYESIKRLIDIIGAAIGLVILSPIFIITAIAIKIESKGPAFFGQDRCGKDGEVFKMLKFRSMVIDAEERLKDLQALNEMTGPVFKIKEDPRITKVGKFIRKTSIDELPQLVNVLLGDMSLVGPRPPIVREVMQYNSYQRQRLLVKPGLTCYWQVSGRNNIDFEEWIELDIKYIRERNLWTDIKLIVKTFFVLFGDENAR
jgi:exopolysaccharide biosynthesis polyprenyl glycosylphosphotransferase